MAKLDMTYMKEVSKGLKAVFNNVLKEGSADYKKVATEINANTLSVDYSWIGDIPSMREWIGEREIKELEANKYSLQTKKWKATIGIDRQVIEYDSLGIIKPRVMDLANSVFTHYDEIVFELLNTDSLCYDGKNMFATDHPVGSSTQSNLFDLQLNQKNFLEVRKEMRGICNDKGKSLNIVPNLLIVPLELEGVALEIMKATNLDSGKSNITKDMCEIFVCSQLKDANTWFLADTKKAIKPFILQINKRVEFVALDNPNHESVFLQDKFLYGVRSEDVAGNGLYQLIVKSTKA